MALKDRIGEILNYMTLNYEQGIEQPRILADILEGRLLPYVEDKMRAELSPKAFNRAKGRIPPINILQKANAKLSQLYNEPVDRSSADENDELLMNDIAQEMDLNEWMQHANKMLNLHRCFALEPYINYEGKRQIRVLPIYQFSVKSDDKENPLCATMFIKRMGSIWEVDSLDPTKTKVERAIYYVYTVDEFMILDSSGQVRYDMMGENQTGVNPIGVLPQVYVSASKVDLIPVQPTDTYAMVTLYPLLQADLNYAIQFCSHSILYGINLEAGVLEGNPDSFWDFKTKEGAAAPQIGTISPTVNIAEVNAHTKDMIGTWLDMIGIKQSTIGNAEVNASASGVAKMIDAGDTTETRRAQILVMENAEKALWKLIAKMQEYWVANRLIEDTRVFSKEFKMNIAYGEMKPLTNSMEDLQKLKIKLDLGLISEDMALREANPELDDDGIEKLKEDIANEKADRIASLPSPIQQPGQKPGQKPNMPMDKNNMPNSEPMKPEDMQGGNNGEAV